MIVKYDVFSECIRISQSQQFPSLILKNINDEYLSCESPSIRGKNNTYWNMNSNEDDRKLVFTYTWTVENLSYCWMQTGEYLFSSDITVERLFNTWWHLNLYSSGKDDGNYIGFFLVRQDLGGPQSVLIDFELSFLACDGSPLVQRSASNSSFHSQTVLGFADFVKKEDVFQLRKCDFLPQDTLTACCRMWSREESVSESGYGFSLTHINLQSSCLLWNIENFSQLQPRIKHTLPIKAEAISYARMDLKLYLRGGQCCEEMLRVDFVPTDGLWCVMAVKLYLLDVGKNKYECGQDQILFLDTEDMSPQKPWTLKLSLSKRKLMENKDIFLPNDVLSLQVELTYPSKSYVDEIVKVEAGSNYILSRDSIVGSRYLQNKEIPFASQNPLKDDLKVMYSEGILSDTKLRTKTETFLAHKNILSARSAEFRAMFTSESNKRVEEIVDVSDWDVDTVRRLLLYMYSDDVENLQWKSAARLYAAAERYSIQNLKEKCIFILKTNLTVTNACELLELAVTLQDEDLKIVVQGYIVRCGKDMFDSVQWNEFMKANLKLAAEIMRQRCVKD